MPRIDADSTDTFRGTTDGLEVNVQQYGDWWAAEGQRARWHNSRRFICTMVVHSVFVALD